MRAPTVRAVTRLLFVAVVLLAVLALVVIVTSTRGCERQQGTVVCEWAGKTSVCRCER